MSDAFNYKKQFMDNGYYICRDIIPVSLIDEVVNWSVENEDNYITETDKLFDTEYKILDWGFTEHRTSSNINNPYIKVQNFLLDYVQELMNMRLIPTYTCGRIHLNDKRGMKWHSDRAPCEISVTMPFAYSGSPWPIWLKANNGKQAVKLKVGDVLLYKGCEIEHHREPHNEEYAFQHYFHFVDVESEVGSLLQYYDQRRSSLWPANLDGMIYRNELPQITESIKNYYKENIK